jgi:CubicO group peptidase (beta-lactamase class C family)
MTGRELGELLRRHAKERSVPGAALGVLRDGVATAAHSGVAAGTRFAVGSLAKSAVATVVARLAASKLLSLDDPVASRVPELAAARWAARATVRDLLANRSGLPLRVGFEFDFSGADGEGDDALSRFVARVAEAEPTTGVWSYTNAGWAVLGRALETATGLAWEEAMRTQLLEPAGMAETAFVGGPRALAPAGTTLVSTVEDMLRFAALHLDDPALAPLRESGEEIRIHGWLDAWCHGWARFDWDGGPVWGWDGLVGEARAVLRLVPQQGGAVVLLTNAGNGRALYRALFPELLARMFGVAMPPLRLDPSPGAAGDLARFAGVYAWPDRSARVEAARDRLVIDADGETVEGLPLDDRTFLVDAADSDTPTVTFGAFDAEGVPHALYLMLWALPRDR